MYRCETWTRKLSAKELMLLVLEHDGVGKDSLESLGLQGDQTSHSYRKSVLNIHWIFTEFHWIFTESTDADAKAPILWPPDAKSWLTRKRLWCWKRLKTGGDGDNRGWDGWKILLTQWTGVWASSGKWSKTGEVRPAAVKGVSKIWTWLRDWTTTTTSPKGWVASGQKTTRESAHPQPSADDWIKALLSKVLPTRARPSFSHHQSLPSESLHKPLSLLYQRVDRSEKNHNPTATKTKPITGYQ